MQQGETTGICFRYFCSSFKENRQKKYRADVLILNWKAHVKVLAVLKEKISPEKVTWVINQSIQLLLLKFMKMPLKLLIPYSKHILHLVQCD